MPGKLPTMTNISLDNVCRMLIIGDSDILFYAGGTVMATDEKLILCLRCNEYLSIKQFRIKLVNPELVDPAILYRPRATCLVCQRQKQREWEANRHQPEPVPRGVTTKVCVRCGEEKPLSEYYKHKTAKWGLDPRCRECKATGEEARQ